MEFNFEKGKTTKFSKGDIDFSATYIGRFDFAYLFDTDLKTFPFVTVYDKKILTFVNTELLYSFNFTQTEIKAILSHEIGHIINSKQQTLTGIDAEYDADNYAAAKYGNNTLISALKKSINVINCIGTKKGKDSISSIYQRINMLKQKNYGER